MLVSKTSKNRKRRRCNLKITASVSLLIAETSLGGNYILCLYKPFPSQVIENPEIHVSLGLYNYLTRESKETLKKAGDLVEGNLLDLHTIILYVHILEMFIKLWLKVMKSSLGDQVPSKDEGEWKKDKCSNDIVVEDKDIDTQFSRGRSLGQSVC